ncbi:replication initiator protein A [Priestia aryabhattai]|uniref:replication initiator protein A n=1 Tax=Priestia aryabhattai TaxID=412384 RepID=UPI002E1B2FDA|nr:replication initiator protein A [Priestia aryabhattai]
MKKQYITTGYIKDLTNKEKATGVFFSSPKVVVKGDKYRDKLKPIEKLLYQELYDMTKKAAHDNQVDKNGNVYIEVSYIFLAVALGVSDSTIQRILEKKTNPLYSLGLLAIKERKDKSKTQYYVMAPDYDGEDEIFLTNDVRTPKMQEKAKELVAKKNRKAISKRETENEQFEKERVFDTVADTAEYTVQKNNMCDFDEPVEKKETASKEPQKEMYLRVVDNQNYNGRYRADFVVKHDGVIFETWDLGSFLEKTKSNINPNQHASYIIKELQEQGEYEIKYECDFEY